MVSTRNTKDKFSDGERVLCYEPDPTKARVLYDSKVLEVKHSKDERGRKRVEYLIHFQGWNSSWDRLVSEDYVLKDTDENRQLQKDLAAKKGLHLGAYLYRKDHSDKEASTLSEKTFEAGNSCSSQDVASAEEDNDYLTATDEDKESVETDDSLGHTIPLELSSAIRMFLEQDYELVNRKHKVIKLPASPTVIQILENYVRHFNSRVLRLDGDETSRPRNSRQAPGPTRPLDKAEELEWICARVNLAKEMVDGLRICFDFYFGSQLLYNFEQVQYEDVKNGTRYFSGYFKQEVFSEDDTSRSEDPFISGRSCNVQLAAPESADAERRRSLRSHRDHALEACTSSTVNGVNKIPVNSLGTLGIQNSVNHCSARSSSSTSSYGGQLAHLPHLVSGPALAPEMARLMSLTRSWRLVPDSYLYQHPQPPSTVYGAVHLARLFVKLPSFLYAANLPEKENQPRFLSDQKMKLLVEHLQSFLSFLESKPEWFSEDNYVAAKTEL